MLSGLLHPTSGEAKVLGHVPWRRDRDLAPALQDNMLQLIEDIRDGKLDHTLTQPADAQLLVSVKEFRLWQLVDVLVGLVLVGVTLVRLGGGAGATGLLAFAATLLIGIVLVHCFWLAIAVSAFWIVRMDFVADLFDGLYQAGHWPVTVYA